MSGLTPSFSFTVFHLYYLWLSSSPGNQTSTKSFLHITDNFSKGGGKC